MSSRKMTLDLHPVFNQGRAIEQALHEAMDEAEARKVKELEIITGKGSGALRKRVLRFLDSTQMRARYHRIDKDAGNHGRIFVHFRFQRGQ